MIAVTVVGEKNREEALDLFDEAIRSGILEESQESAATYRFSHALFQEAIYEGLTPSLRARLHRAAAKRLEQQHAGALEPVLSELAHHHHHAIAVGDPERAFDFAMGAARQAERLLAWEQAAGHYEQAVASFEHFESVDPERRVETLLALGEAHRLSGNRVRRVAAFEQAIEVARALDAPPTFARAAIGLCDVSEWSARVPDNTTQIVEEALEGVDDDVAVARLTTRLGYLQVRDRVLAEPFARDGFELARKSRDPVALQESIYVLLYVLAGPDYLGERAGLMTELKEAAEGCVNRDVSVIAVLDVACDGLIEGDLEKAMIHRAIAVELGGRHPSPTMRWHRSIWDAGFALLQGRFAEAEQGIHDALLLGRRIGHPFARAGFGGQICLLDRDRGREETVIEQLGASIGDSRLGATHWAAAVVARSALARGDRKRASALLESLATPSFGEIPRTIRWNGTMLEVAMLAAELESAEHARDLIDLLKTAPDQHGLLPMVIDYSGPLSRALAALSGVLGNADEAIAFYEDALESASALGARPVVARTQLEAAPLIARSGDTGRAAELLNDCMALADEIGMPSVASDAAKALERY